MGWEAKENRLFFTGTRVTTRLTHAAVCVDVAEALRKTLPPQCTMTPFELLSRILWRDLHKNDFTTIVLCFDNPDLMPRVRKEVLYKNRYKAHTYEGEKPGKKWSESAQRYFALDAYPVADDVATTTTAHFIPAPWNNIFSSSKGKHYAFKAIEDSAIEIITKAGPNGIQYIIHRQDGTQFSSPQIELPSFPYGEGDQLVVHYALLLRHTIGIPRVLVRSGDWDVTMSLMGFNHRGIDIQVNRIFMDATDDRTDIPYDKQTCELTRKKAMQKWKSIKPVYELVHADDMQRQSRTWRINFVFFALCAGGADYCAGGTRKFGFTETPMRILAFLGLRCIAFAYDPKEPKNRILRFYPREFARALAKGKRMKNRNDNIDEFSSCLHFIIFNLRYYFGCDGNHAPGGPEPPDTSFHLFPGPKSVTEMLKNPMIIKTAHINFHEMYPTEEFKYAPECMYDGAQLVDIKKCLPGSVSTSTSERPEV